MWPWARRVNVCMCFYMNLLCFEDFDHRHVGIIHVITAVLIACFLLCIFISFRFAHTTHSHTHTNIHMYIRYHLTATYDSSTMRLFTNGLLTTSSSTQSGPIQYPNSATFAIGAYIDGPYKYVLRGALDDVALWNRAVAVDAVAAMYATHRNSAYFCCPTSCPDGTISTELCVGDVTVDCRTVYPCPKCSTGMDVCMFIRF
jgi:hypothetical protein